MAHNAWFQGIKLNLQISASVAFGEVRDPKRNASYLIS